MTLRPWVKICWPNILEMDIRFQAILGFIMRTRVLTCFDP